MTMEKKDVKFSFGTWLGKSVAWVPDLLSENFLLCAS